VAEHLVLEDFSFDRACRRIEGDVDQSAKQDIGSLTGSDEMVDVVDREFRAGDRIGGPVVRLRQRATEAIGVASRQADHRNVVRRLVDGEVETRARILDEDQVLLLRSRELNGFGGTRILSRRQHPSERHVDLVRETPDSLRGSRDLCIATWLRRWRDWRVRAAREEENRSDQSDYHVALQEHLNAEPAIR
jgi:hypothetical protein